MDHGHQHQYKSEAVRRWAQVLVPIAAAAAYICVAVAVGNPWTLPALLVLAWLLWPDRVHPLIGLARAWVEQRNQQQQQIEPAQDERASTVTRLPRGRPPDAGA